MGASPDPAQKSTSGARGSAGGWKAAADGRTAICTLSPGRRLARYVDATPRNRSVWPASAGVSMTLTVSVTRCAFHRGEEEMEYCRTRIAGINERNAAKLMAKSGYCSRRSSTLRRRPRTCSPYDSSRFCSASFVAGESADAKSVRTSRVVAG